MSARTLLVALLLTTAGIVGTGASPAYSAASPTDELIEQMTEVGKQVPPFGGAFVEDGTLRIWLLQTPAYPVDQAAEEARTALAEVAGMDYDRDQVEILDADYSWANLVWWYERLPFALTAVPAVVDHEISIETNRIRVVVDDVDANRQGVVAELERSDIAVGAVEMVEAPAVDGFIDSNGVAVGVLAGLLIVLLILLASMFAVRRRGRPATRSTDDQHTSDGGSADAEAMLEEDAAEAGATSREATSAATAGQDGRDSA